MKALFVLLLLILFIPLPGLSEGLFNFLWNVVPGYMTLATITAGLVYFAFKFNRVVLRIETLEKDVHEMKVSIDKRFEKIDTRFERLESRLEKLEDKIKRIMEILVIGKPDRL